MLSKLKQEALNQTLICDVWRTAKYGETSVKRFTKLRTVISPHYYKLPLRSENKESLSKVQARCGSVAYLVTAS